MTYLNKDVRKSLKKWNKEYGDKPFTVTSRECKTATVKELLKLGYIEKVIPFPDIAFYSSGWEVLVRLTSTGQNYIDHGLFYSLYGLIVDLLRLKRSCT